MAQLTNDCFAFGSDLLSVDQALQLIVERIAPIGDVDQVPVSQAAGRILAADVVARVSVPAFDNSAVDGYAVRHADLAPATETRLPLGGRVQAGAAPHLLKPGTAIRIFTGAVMPAGADTVFMQEDVREEHDAVILPPGLKCGANRRFAGEDFMTGHIAVAGRRRIDARIMAALTAAGIWQVPVRRQVKIALFSTGDELAAAEAPLAEGQTYDANRPLLAALIKARGALVTDLGILRDDAAATADALCTAAQDHDIIITSGGVSTGEADFVKQAVEQAGELNFWRLAIKPGRPVAMGTIGGAAFVGLPGNPVAAFVTFVHLAAALIDRLAGTDVVAPMYFPAVADFSYRKKPGRREYVRASLRQQDLDNPIVTKYPREGAALISSLTQTDGLVEFVETTTEINPGDKVRFLPYQLLI